MKKLLLFSFLIFHYYYFNAQTDTMLIIRPDGHKATIRGIAITKDGKNIVSAGEDKSILIWDAENGEIVDEIYGQQPEGNEGTIFAIALSPDNRHLAIGGFMAQGHGVDDDKVGQIRLYNFPSRRLIALLKGHTDIVTSLSFSNDSEYLISGSADKTVKLWKIPDGVAYEQKIQYQECQQTFKGHTKDVYAVAMYDSLIVSGAFDKTVRLWKIGNPVALKVSNWHLGVIECISFSPDGKIISSGGRDRSLIIYNKQLELQSLINNQVSPSNISFSPDGKKLVCTPSASTGTYPCKLYENQFGNWKYIAAYEGHNNNVMASAFLNDNTVITAGGDNNEIAIWQWDSITSPKSNPPIQQAKLLHQLKGKGQSVFAVGIDGDSVGFTNIKPAMGSAMATDLFNLKTHNRSKNTNKNLGKPTIQQNGFSLFHHKGGNYGFNNAVLTLNEDKTTLATITRSSIDGFFHSSYTFTPNDYIISGGTNGILSAFDLSGKILNNFIGHTGTVWGLSVSKDRKKIISGSNDQSIRIWNLEKVGKEEVKYKDTKWFEQPVNSNYIIKNYPGYGFVTMKEKQKLYEKMLENGDDNARNILDYPKIYPTASIFLASDDEWIIWCNDGYYCSSKRGGKYVGWLINQGEQNNALMYPFEQFDLRNNRPDIINQRLGVGDSLYNYALFKAYQKRLKKMNISEDMLSSDFHLPKIKLENNIEYHNTKEFISLNINATDAKYKLDRINIWINNIPVFGVNGINLRKKNISKISKNIKVLLSIGKNKIDVSVLNQVGVESLKQTIYVNYTPKETTKPNLYVVAIGVSEYHNNHFNLNYASKDATDLCAEFLNKNEQFGEIKIIKLLDKEASLDKIKAIKDTLMQSNIEDEVVVFFAGHGLLDEDLDYYLALSNMNFDKPSVFGLPYEELENLLDGIPARKKLLLIDACHSGEVDKEETNETETVTENTKANTKVVHRGVSPLGFKKSKKKVGLKNSFELMKELFADLRRGTGAMVISSAGGGEFAFEGEQWKNGVFTYSVIQALRTNKADMNKDGVVQVSELRDFVQDMVKKLTNGKQNPTSRRENLEFDFGIW